MKVLLTGSSGYAGAAIAARMRTAGHEVLTAGRRADAAINLDLSRPQEARKLVLPAGVDACVHAAAAHEVQCRNDPVLAYTVNVTGTRALLEAALAAGIGSFVYLSTFHVFGNPQGTLTEDSPPRPANDYGLSHLFAEQLTTMLCAARGATSHVLRPGNLYGVPADWARFDRWTLAPFDFVRQAVATGRIRLLSDGSPLRNYVSLDALGEAVLVTLGGKLPGTTHLAGRAWSMLELARLAAQASESVTGRVVTVETGPPGPAELPWNFRSLTTPAEDDGDGQRMRDFLAAVAQYEARSK